MKLNVGSGPKEQEGYVNIDKFNPGVGIIAYAEALPFVDGSIEEILASHLIEHLVPAEQNTVFREWHRVLASGGKLVIRCPNFDLYVKEYLEASNEQRARNPWFLRYIFGWRDRPGQFHCDGFTRDRLQRTLCRYGFEEVSCKLIETRQKRGVQYRPNGDILCEARKP